MSLSKIKKTKSSRVQRLVDSSSSESTDLEDVAYTASGPLMLRTVATFVNRSCLVLHTAEHTVLGGRGESDLNVNRFISQSTVDFACADMCKWKEF